MRIFNCKVSKKSVNDWKTLADDFLKELSMNNKSSEKIGIGHSMGATILLYSAIKAPNFFSKIILLDPVIFTPLQCKMWRVINLLGLGLHFHPLAKKALKRKTEFNSLSDIFDRYKKYRIFKKFSDQSLRNYIGSVFEQKKDKYVLNYDINIEVEYYLSALTLEPFIFKNISKTESKIFLLYPEFNSAISNKSIKKISQFLYSDELELKGLTHFFPIEDGKLVFENIQKILV
tara:strand:- start:30 stop:725 length:696 start_codon:yes stop_codon:yes gene_type:complete